MRSAEPAIGGEAHGRGWRGGGIVEESAQQANRAELDRDAEAVVVAAVLADEGPIDVVEMKVAGELIGRGVAGKAPVATGLVVGEKADRHRSGY
jgi:hypothetical protein